ncbi:hypothetical protein ACFXQA_09860 [Microbacterium sp. P07]|uniref:hypothetical protein n=1 Tax=Microbacterium sp. P07 TaxID=3366952 RepID=UPI003745BFC5
MNNVLVVSRTHELSPIPGGGVEVHFQINPFNAKAFPGMPGNIANLNVYAGYSSSKKRS